VIVKGSTIGLGCARNETTSHGSKLDEETNQFGDDEYKQHQQRRQQKVHWSRLVMRSGKRSQSEQQQRSSSRDARGADRIHAPATAEAGAGDLAATSPGAKECDQEDHKYEGACDGTNRTRPSQEEEKAREPLCQNDEERYVPGQYIGHYAVVGDLFSEDAQCSYLRCRGKTQGRCKSEGRGQGDIDHLATSLAYVVDE
jgi:hypothetical protein